MILKFIVWLDIPSTYRCPMYMRCFSKAFCTSCSDSISIKASPLRFPSLFKRKCIPFSPLRILQSKSMWAKSIKTRIQTFSSIMQVTGMQFSNNKTKQKPKCSTDSLHKPPSLKPSKCYDVVVSKIFHVIKISKP